MEIKENMLLETILNTESFVALSVSVLALIAFDLFSVTSNI